MPADITETMRNATPEIQEIIRAVFEIEAENLAKERPQVVKEIKTKIEEIII
jgi:hypothetical protein